ncbi:MAG: arginyltransferase [Magnetovibrio sp.]|nr:arginyltransferase [Magnetovibrio sp.]
MQHDAPKKTRFFFTTTPMPCPYLEGRIEQRMVTELIGPDATELGYRLSLAGFRRSHTISYAPVCDGCSACVSVRVPVRDFKPNKTQRKNVNRNADLSVEEHPPIATPEQYRLFKSYVNARHFDGDMSLMEEDDYSSMIEETTVRTAVVEFHSAQGDLVACVLIDYFEDGLSAIYSFYDAEQSSRSLGTYVVLWLIDYVRMQGLDYLYLGYWVQGSPKMEYKRNFKPLEGYTSSGWKRLSDGAFAKKGSDK